MRNSGEYNLESNREYWKDWLIKKDEKKEIGYRVSKKIRELVSTRIDEVKKKQIVLERETESLKVIKGLLIDEMGMNEYHLSSLWHIKRKFNDHLMKMVEKEAGSLPARYQRDLKKAQSYIEGVLEFCGKAEA